MKTTYPAPTITDKKPVCTGCSATGWHNMFVNVNGKYYCRKCYYKLNGKKFND